MTTRKQINAALPPGYTVERSGPGTFYFVGPGTERWPSTQVLARTLSQLTVAQWVGEFEELRAACPEESA